jgi:hypothetical protein
MGQIRRIASQRDELIIEDKKANTKVEDAAPMLEELSGEEPAE